MTPSPSPAVWQKMVAIGRMGRPDRLWLSEIQRLRLDFLVQAAITGLVVDYDGTILPSRSSLTCLDPAILAQLARLHEHGLSIAIATGRGPSAGEELRVALPCPMHQHVLIGYYNGGYIRALSDVVDRESVPVSPDIQAVNRWLDEHAQLFSTPGYRRSGLQTTIEARALRDPYSMLSRLADCEPIRTARCIVLRSATSIDICPATSTKCNVVTAIEKKADGATGILRLGDCGAEGGNDHAMLAHPLGISVGTVCSAANGTWSLFGQRCEGPAALLRVLRALVPAGRGLARFDLTLL